MLPAMLHIGKCMQLFCLFFKNFYPFFIFQFIYEGHVPVNSRWHTSFDVHAIV